MIIIGSCKCRQCTNFPDIAQEKSKANIKQKDKIVQDSYKKCKSSVHEKIKQYQAAVMATFFFFYCFSYFLRQTYNKKCKKTRCQVKKL